MVQIKTILKGQSEPFQNIFITVKQIPLKSLKIHSNSKNTKNVEMV